MNDLLSQEEIDALLNAGDSDPADETSETPTPEPPADSPEQGEAATGGASGGASDGSSGVTTTISKEAIEQLSEVAKLSLGATSSVVQVLLNKEIKITLEQVRMVSFSDLAAEGGSEEFVLAKIAYIEGFDGNSYLVLKKSISAVIGDLMMGGEGVDAEFQEMHISALGEMMNQMMGKTTTSLSEIFKKRVDISPPEVFLVNYSEGPPDLPDFSENANFLRIGYSLKIGEVAETEMVQLLPADFAKLMASELNRKDKTPPKKQKPAPPGGIPMGNKQGQNQANQMPGMGMPGQMPGQTPGQTPGQIPGMGMPGQFQGSPAEFGMLQMPMGTGLQSNIDLLLDVPLQITVELGRTRMLIKDVLELGIGSVVELNKLAGEAVEVFVNNKLIAKGEVVVIDENFAVRITSIINPQDRLQAL